MDTLPAVDGPGPKKTVPVTHSILFVDDEENILESMKREFRLAPYTLLFALSGPRALDILRTTTVSVIVSDMRMPMMDGVTFLQKAKKAQPKTVRIILSGHADMQTVLQAVESGDIWRFLVKPWEHGDLVETVKKAVERHEALLAEP
jgi:DNA-binding NtrC family response regulator